MKHWVKIYWSEIEIYWSETEIYGFEIIITMPEFVSSC